MSLEASRVELDRVRLILRMVVFSSFLLPALSSSVGERRVHGCGILQSNSASLTSHFRIWVYQNLQSKKSLPHRKNLSWH